jgi:hypothetical protein
MIGSSESRARSGDLSRREGRKATGAAAFRPGRPCGGAERGCRYIIPSVFGSQIDIAGQ